MRKAIIPGSFDPITLGHLDLFERASGLFDEIIVLVTYNSQKKYIASAEERANLIRHACAHISNLSVETNSRLVVDYAREKGIKYFVKGIRSGSDADYEMQMAYVNRTVGAVETVFLPTREEFVYISSSIVRELVSYGGSILGLVPGEIENEIRELYKKR